MKIVVVGHVDHGKSTLIGRLFHDANVLPDGRMAQLSAAAERRGSAFEFANFADGLQVERDQNVTIETTQILFRWQGNDILFIDAPGHREFIKNMVTGASQADAALLIIDAVHGIDDQTRRHALLLTILGISHVIVVVNKIDKIADHDRVRRFDDTAKAASEILAPLDIVPHAIVPAAASLGWNIVGRTAEMDWHDGPTVLEAVVALNADRVGSHQSFTGPTGAPPAAPAVFSVQDVYRRDAQRWLVGRIECGHLNAGDTLTVLPSGHTATIDRVDPSAAFTIHESLFVARGDVLASADAQLSVAGTVHARIFWLGRTPMTMNRRYEVRLGTQHTDAEVMTIARVIDASTLTERTDRSQVPPNDVADIEMRLSRPLVVDASGRARALSRLVIIDKLPAPDIVGGGVVLRSTAAQTTVAAAAPYARVGVTERHQRLGHRGMVLWLTGLSGAGKSTLADGLERALFDRGMHAVVLDGDRVRFGLNADLGFSQEDRRENIRRVAETAKLFAEIGVIAITAFISPSAEDRRRAREIASPLPFIEVFVDADLSVCESRDPKGLYRKARAGEIADFTGVSAPYDTPAHAEVVIKSATCSAAEGIAVLVETVVTAVRLDCPASETPDT